MGLLALVIDGVAHGFAIDGEAVVGFAMGRIPTLEGAVEVLGIDADEQVAYDVFARHQAATVVAAAAEPFARLGAQTLGPVRHGLVAPHPTQRGPGGEREDGREGMPASLGAAGIGDVGKERGQQSHMVGSQHDRGSSMTIRFFKDGPRQQGPGISVQGVHKDPLGGGGRSTIAVRGAPKAFGVPHIDPVRGFVEGSLEPSRIDKGFQQQQRMPKALLPVSRQAPLAQRQGARRQVGPMPGRQDQEPAVVGQQRQAIVLMAERPPDPAIPNRTFPGGGGKAEQRDPGLAPSGHVPEGFADLGKGAQIMMRLHQLLIPQFFGTLNGTDKEVVQDHSGSLG